LRGWQWRTWATAATARCCSTVATSCCSTAGCCVPQSECSTRLVIARGLSSCGPAVRCRAVGKGCGDGAPGGGIWVWSCDTMMVTKPCHHHGLGLGTVSRDGGMLRCAECRFHTDSVYGDGGAWLTIAWREGGREDRVTCCSEGAHRWGLGGLRAPAACDALPGAVPVASRHCRA
jgi:hypothetical protein